MYVYVNGQERELHVYDRKQEKDYAKMLVCAQEQLDTDEYGSFCTVSYTHLTLPTNREV